MLRTRDGPRALPPVFVTSPAPCPYLPGKSERKVFTELKGPHADSLNDALDPSRRAQLQRDLSLTAEQRLREADDIAVVPQARAGALEQPRMFRTYDEFAAWRRLRSTP